MLANAGCPAQKPARDIGARRHRERNAASQAGVDLRLIGAEHSVTHVGADHDITVTAQQCDAVASQRARQRFAEFSGLDEQIGHARRLTHLEHRHRLRHERSHMTNRS